MCWLVGTPSQALRSSHLAVTRSERRRLPAVSRLSLLHCACSCGPALWPPVFRCRSTRVAVSHRLFQRLHLALAHQLLAQRRLAAHLPVQVDELIQDGAPRLRAAVEKAQHLQQQEQSHDRRICCVQHFMPIGSSDVPKNLLQFEMNDCTR